MDNQSFKNNSSNLFLYNRLFGSQEQVEEYTTEIIRVAIRIAELISDCI